jgi:hypothetical protein
VTLRRARGGLSRPPVLAALAPALALAAAAILSGCGGSAQNAGEPSASFTMAIVGAHFPALQTIARPERMELSVRNSSLRTVPNLAVTVDSFNYVSKYPELAAANRPVWAIEQGPGAIAKVPAESQEVSPPGGAQTAYVNTWSLGPVPAGATRTFAWRVVPVKPGVHTVHFKIAAGLAGNAQARLASGGPVQGRFLVHISAAPPRTYVNPRTGRVQQGPVPIIP